MNLNIKDRIDKSEISGSEYNLTIESLHHKGTHLFIASNKWDELHITITEDIPIGVLKYVRMCVNKVFVVIKGEQTEHIMELMCELYPEYSGKLHKAFMLHKDLKEVVMNER